MRRINLPAGELIRTIGKRFGRKIFKYRQMRDILPGTATLSIQTSGETSYF